MDRLAELPGDGRIGMSASLDRQHFQAIADGIATDWSDPGRPAGVARPLRSVARSLTAFDREQGHNSPPPAPPPPSNPHQPPCHHQVQGGLSYDRSKRLIG